MSDKKEISTYWGLPKSTWITIIIFFIGLVSSVVVFYFQDQREVVTNISEVATANVELKGNLEVINVRISSLNNLFINYQNKQKELEELMRVEIKRLEAEIVELKLKKSN